MAVTVAVVRERRAVVAARRVGDEDGAGGHGCCAGARAGAWGGSVEKERAGGWSTGEGVALEAALRRGRGRGW